MKMKFFLVLMFCGFAFWMVGCNLEKTSDDIQQAQQETLLKEATAQTGMPAIKNFRERKILKDILELRDQDGLITYTYIYSQMTGKFTFLGESIGYGIPYATQYTNPQKVEYASSMNNRARADIVLPQADPNGLFSPAAAEGTWILMRDPNSGKVRPQYVEDRIAVFTFRLPDGMLNK
jgi:hypothetical protein